jgi:hypothetical protein
MAEVSISKTKVAMGRDYTGRGRGASKKRMETSPFGAISILCEFSVMKFFIKSSTDYFFLPAAFLAGAFLAAGLAAAFFFSATEIHLRSVFGFMTRHEKFG